MPRCATSLLREVTLLPVCRSCATPLVGRPGGPGDVTHGTVRGLCEAPLAWSCPRGHESHTIDAAAAADEVVEALDVGVRGRFRQQLRCGVCTTDLVLPGRRAQRSVTITGAGVPATRLTFDVPLVRCTEDAVENLPPECVDDLRTVVALLLEHDPDPSVDP